MIAVVYGEVLCSSIAHRWEDDGEINQVICLQSKLESQNSANAEGLLVLVLLYKSKEKILNMENNKNIRYFNRAKSD